MAVVKILSTQITNRDATPEVISSSNIASGRVLEASGTVAIGAADTTASTYRICSIPSNARVSQVTYWNDASQGADAAYTLDLWDTTANGAAVVKAGFFAPDIDLTTIQNAVDASHTTSGAGTNLMSGGEKMVWQNLSGLSSDPQKWYDVVLASTTNNTTPGSNFTLKIKYVIGA